MSLESLFEHIIFSEHQAEKSRRALREGQGAALWGRVSGAEGRGGIGVEFAVWRERQLKSHMPTASEMET